MESLFTIGRKRTASGKRSRQADEQQCRSAIETSMRFLTIPAVLLASAVAVPAADEPGIIKGSDQFEFVYRVKLPEIKGDARVWIPLAKTDAFQTVTEEELNIPMKWEKVQDRDYGNDICVLYPQPSDSGKTVEVRYRGSEGENRLSGKRRR